ncbi:MAG TPA: LysR family transcriptional regulator [Candidatus Didemnitutus sp.]|nr:LysR family transcriptional regulator [Candidatus Didemnitutus sp.]
MNKALDSRQLLAFAALARRQSFTAAAKDLHLTQSAVSHAIRALEEELGCRLFDRGGRAIKVTQAGEQLLRHVEVILREMQAARADLDASLRWGQGRLRIGASTTACQHILPTVLREFRQSFPQCVINVEPGDFERQIELLRANAVDLAVMIEPERERDLAYVPLFEDELRLIVSPMHPWAQEGRVPRDGLARETLVLYNKVSYTFRVVSDYLRAEGLAPGPVIELGSMEAIKELVKIGLGIGILAPWVARKELESGALVDLPLGRRRLRRRWCVAHLRGRKLPLGEETFVGLCQAVVGEIGTVRRPAEVADTQAKTG